MNGSITNVFASQNNRGGELLLTRKESDLLFAESGLNF